MKIKILLGIFALTAIFSLTSCQKEDPISSNLFDETNNLISYGTFVEDLSISNLDLENEARLLNEMEPERIDKGGMFGGKMPTFRFKSIFDKLNLSEDQKEQIKVFFKAHIDCERAARMAFFEKISSFLEETNLKRQEIIDQLNAGTIDKVTAKENLKALNEELKAKIEASGAQSELKEALKLCLDNLLTNIRGILVSEQLTAFNEWLTKGGSNIGTGNGGGKGPGEGKGHGKGKDDKKPTIRLYDTLGFNAEQISAANGFFNSHKDCYKLAFEAFNAKIEPFVEEAKLQRQSIHDQLKSGAIDKETAKQNLQLIETELKEKITTSGAQAELDAALKACDDILKANLESIMSEDQKILFNILLENQVIKLSGPGIGPKK